MTTQYGRSGPPPAKVDKEPVPGLLEDLALAAAKIYYLTAAGSGPRRRPSTVESLGRGPGRP
ncbi:hypothetical protein [Virgisporangium aurantiacum]|uniref:Uncharacterized protein n=1 Tax=Virgisporangium aurantiacum TaxID=175570 RepID=A0A8J3Z9E8_9ACTN|nr:hypothetical protein [Virgisporangium aurantiacum]GIJ60004.1 hypothetical protein Vau01_075200 [Virgisporangium aurantiacum]